ncbi:sensor histidine kinase [Hoyosella subflava]|uniref:sensor histidine kinase n=1 Tax=Hoyosella subflava TaxID=639313 RepID=UPI00030C2B99|nr:histidine kinase [Hoyosella subflava]
MTDPQHPLADNLLRGYTAAAAGIASGVLLYVLAMIPELSGDAGRRFLSSPGTQILAIILIGAMTGMAALRTRFPEWMFLATITATVLLMIVLDDRSLGASVLYWFAIAWLAASVSGSRMAWLLLTGMIADLATGFTLGAGATHSTESYTQLQVGEVGQMLIAPAVNILVSYGVFILAGKLIARHQRLKQDSTRRIAALDGEREQRIREAVLREREDMARELHDVAAHDVAGMLIQARAADKVFDNHPGQARELLTDIISQGERTLTSLRQVVGILRLHDAHHDQPRPSLAHLADLAEAARQHGITTALTIDGDLTSLDNAVQLSCYRIVQESLANIRQHAPASTATLTVTRTPAGVCIMITNTASTHTPEPGGNGYGIAGMRERAEMLGGTLTSEPGHHGGWTVTASIPATGRISG